MNQVADLPPQTLTHRQILATLGALMMGMALGALDQTIVATALPTIVAELGGLSRLSWVITAYMLASTVVTPIYGKLGDTFGRKAVFQTAIVLFLLGSITAGAAHSMAQLIAFRGLQGIGAGGLMVTAQAIIGDILAPRERGRYQGYIGAVFGACSILGPVIGGLCTQYLTWRWVFYLNIPLGIAALFVTGAVLPGGKPRANAGAPKIDYAGITLLSTAVTCLVLVTTWGGSVYGWTSPPLLGLVALAVACVIGFALVERRAPDPLIPPALFGDHTFDVAGTTSFIIGFAMFGVISFLPMFMQVVAGASATGSGLLLVPFMFGLLAASIVSGRRIAKTGKYKRFPLTGTALATVGMFLFSRMNERTPLPLSILFVTLCGVGLGLTMQVMVVATQNSVDRRHLGVATSSITFFRSVGGSCGVAVFGAIFNARLKSELATMAVSIGPALLGSGEHGSTGGLLKKLAALPPDERLQVAGAFARSLSTCFLMAAPCLALAFVMVILLREKPLRGRGPADHATAAAAAASVVEG